MNKTFLTIGLLIVTMGLLWPFLEKFGLGKLPGDIFIDREDLQIYFPITSCVLVSLLLSFVLGLFKD